MANPIKSGVKLRLDDFELIAHNDHMIEVDEDEEVQVRVLYILPTVNTVYVTMKKHFFNADSCDNLESKVGEIVKKPVILNASKIGLTLQLNNTESDSKMTGFVSLKHISDNNVSKMDIGSKFQVGSKIKKCRIIGFDAADSMFICSMQKSILSQSVLHSDQLRAGDKVKAKVTKFVDRGAVVEMGKNMFGFIPNIHLTDIPLKKPEKKFPIGITLDCRVLINDPERKKLLLTHKKILLKEDYEIVGDYDEVNVGKITEGVVVSVTKSGLLLTLFGGVKGWVPKSKMSQEQIEYPEKLFYIGQALKCQILHVDVERKRMTLTLDIKAKFQPLGRKEKRMGDDVKLGAFYDCVVKEVAEDGLAVEVEMGQNEEKVKAFIPSQHLSDYPRYGSKLLKTYSVDDVINDALCFEKDVLPILTLKSLIIEAAKHDQLPMSFDDLLPGVSLPGVICLIKNYGVFIR